MSNKSLKIKYVHLEEYYVIQFPVQETTIDLYLKC